MYFINSQTFNLGFKDVLRGHEESIRKVGVNMLKLYHYISATVRIIADLKYVQCNEIR